MGTLMESSDVNLGSGYRAPEVFMMGAPTEYYSESFRTIGIDAREAAYETLVEPIPISLKTYKHYHMNHSHHINYFPHQQMIPTYAPPPPRVPVALELVKPSTSCYTPNTVTALAKVEVKNEPEVQPPPKKKWIKEYLEEPKSPLPVRLVTALPVVAPRTNGVVRVTSPPPLPLPLAVTPSVALEPASAPYLDFTQEHSRPRTTSNSHGPAQIPSPPSVSSSGSNGSGSSIGTPRAGTREVHNKLEKNRRAHLKECFELLKRQLPTAPDDKKTSNLSILGSAIRYIQVLRRKEREYEHEMERLAREKISAQQRLTILKRDVTVLASNINPGSIETVIEDMPRDERVNGQVLGIPISITSSPPAGRLESPPQSLNLSTKLRMPVKITPTTSQVVRTSYGSLHNTLTLTAIGSADQVPTSQSSLGGGVCGVGGMGGVGGHEGGVNTLGTTLMHPAQIHLPITQMVGGGGLVVGGSLQLLSAPTALRVLHAPQLNGVSATDSNRINRENGIISSANCSVSESNGNVVVSGLTPIVVSQPTGHLLHSHSLTHKMMETQMVKGSVAPLTVSAQYLSATTIVKPVVMVSGSATPPSTSA